MSAGSCAYCNCGQYDDSDGRSRPDDDTPICWCGHSENEHNERPSWMDPPITPTPFD